MKVANLELCKELEELSWWKDTRDVWSFSYVASADTRKGKMWHVARPDKRVSETVPAYDLGYLLRKPVNVLLHVDQSCAAIFEPDGRNIAFVAPRDKPEDAVCGLYVELFKQNILTKEAA